MIPRMQQKYREQASKAVAEQFGVTNPMALPKFDKIVLTVGMGNQLEGTKLNPVAKQQVLSDLALITGQKPLIKRAKKAVSNFKIREGYEIGAMVTLRGDHMWEFFDRLVTLAIPRIKDFRGLKTNSFDRGGNYSFGVTEQAIFPEINMAEAKYTHGMNITFTIKNSDADKSRALLAAMGLPFTRPENQPGGQAA